VVCDATTKDHQTRFQGRNAKCFVEVFSIDNSYPSLFRAVPDDFCAFANLKTALARASAMILFRPIFALRETWRLPAGKPVQRFIFALLRRERMHP